MYHIVNTKNAVKRMYHIIRYKVSYYVYRTDFFTRVNKSFHFSAKVFPLRWKSCCTKLERG